MVVGIVAVLAIGSVSALGNRVNDTFVETADALSTNLSAGAEDQTDGAGGAQPAANSVAFIEFQAAEGPGGSVSGPIGFYRDSYGTIVNESPTGSIERIYLDSSGSVSYLRYDAVYGNTNRSLACNGITVPFADAQDISYSGGMYYVVWDLNPLGLVDGETYACDVLSLD